MTAETPGGFVATFYSYKGGVGRSMALANVALLLHERPLNVVMVDWDLEAPGLERYFADRYPAADPERVTDHIGLADLIKTYLHRVTRPPAKGAASLYPDLDDHLVTITETDGATLRLLPCGRRTEGREYASFVQDFDWSGFYEDFGGGGFFEWLRRGLAGRADVVLIDSRTGITEMGGVATHHLADVVVMLYAANEENMLSSAQMARAFASPATREQRGGRPLPVIQVPSRVDPSDSVAYSEFVERLNRVMRPVLQHIGPDPPDPLDLLIPYVPVLSYRERLLPGDAVLETAARPVLDCYERIALRIRMAAPDDSAARRGVAAIEGRVLVAIHAEPGMEERADAMAVALRHAGVSVAPSGGPDGIDHALLSACRAVVLVLSDTAHELSRQAAALVSALADTDTPIVPVRDSDNSPVPPELADTVALSLAPDGVRPAPSTEPAVTVEIADHTGTVWGVAFSPDGQRLATASGDNTARIWHTATGRSQATLSGHGAAVNGVAFSPDGRLLATAGDDGSARIWDTTTGQTLTTLTGHTDWVRKAVFSPDGRHLATASNDGSARIWDTTTGQTVTTITEHTGPVLGAAFSADGRRLATASSDRTARIWDTTTGQILITLSGHTGPVREVALSPDGRRLATASSDRTVRIWDTTTGQTLTTLTGHTGPVREVAFSPDGRRLATASSDGTARIWDAATGQTLTTLTGHTGEVRAVAFSIDRRRLATAGDDCTARIWDTGEDALESLASEAEAVAERIASSLRAARQGRADAFLSYASADGNIVLPVAEAVGALGAGLVWDATVLQPGDQWRRSLRESLAAAQLHVFAVTRASVESRFALQELAYSAGAGKRILPVIFQQVPSGELPYELLDLQHVDLVDLPVEEQAKKLKAAIDDMLE